METEFKKTHKTLLILLGLIIVLIIIVCIFIKFTGNNEKDAPYGPGSPHIENAEQSNPIVPEPNMDN